MPDVHHDSNRAAAGGTGSHARRSTTVAQERRRGGDRRRRDRRLVDDRRVGDRRAGGPDDITSGAATALELAAGAVSRRAVVATVVVATLGMVLTAIVGLLGPDRSTDALTINLAGRQRMLSQRMAGAAVLAAAGDADARRRLDQSWSRFATAHAALRNGDGTLGIRRVPDADLVAAYAGAGGLDEQVAAFGEHVEVLLGGDGAASGPATAPVRSARERAASAIVAAAAGPLLDSLDEAVAIDQRAAERRSDTAGALAWLELALLVVAVGFAGIGLYRPLVGELRRSAGVVRRVERDAARSADWHRRFSTIAAHELRTPVTVVAGLTATLMARWDDLDDSLRRDVMIRVAAQGDSMTGLVEELSMIAGLASTPVVHEPWQLAEIVDALVDSHDVVVEVAAAAVVTVDRRRLELVLRELVDNAQRHGEPPVTAIVRTTTAGDVVVEVTDRGPGAPPAEVRHLLEPFTRSTDVDNHRSADGQGIGLAVVAGIAGEVGGHVHQRTAAQGCTWVVVFPGSAVTTVG